MFGVFVRTNVHCFGKVGLWQSGVSVFNYVRTYVFRALAKWGFDKVGFVLQHWGMQIAMLAGWGNVFKALAVQLQ